jgi:hypothetical protein
VRESVGVRVLLREREREKEIEREEIVCVCVLVNATKSIFPVMCAISQSPETFFLFSLLLACLPCEYVFFVFVFVTGLFVNEKNHQQTWVFRVDLKVRDKNKKKQEREKQKLIVKIHLQRKK